MDDKPCPFCGSIDTMIYLNYTREMVECGDCGASGPLDAIRVVNNVAFKVGEFRSSSRPGRKVLCVTEDMGEAQGWEKRKDFIRWVYPT